MGSGSQQWLKLLGVLVLMAFPQAAAAAPIGQARQPADAAPASQAQELVNAGFRLLAAGQVDDAAQAFEHAKAKNPGSVNALVGLAEVALRQQRPEVARTHLQAAASLAPDDPSVHVAAARYYLSQGDYDASKAAYERGIAADPRTLQAYLGLGDLNLGARQAPAEASAAYRQAVELAPEFAPGWHGLGMSLLASGDRNAALTALETAARLDESDYLSRHIIGRIHASEGRMGQAAAALTSALRINPQFVAALYDRADVLAESGRDLEAIADYQRIVTLNPRDAASRLKLGMLYHRTDRLDQAEKTYRDALRISDDLAPAHNNLAVITLERQGDVDAAIAGARRAVELAPDVPHFHGTLGWAYRADGDLEAARDSLERATQLPPPQPRIWYRLGVVLEELGRHLDARSAYETALHSQEGFPEADEARIRLTRLQ